METSHSGGETGSASSAARICAIVGFVCAAISLLFIPIVFGPAAIILGIIATVKGDRLGKWTIIAGVVGFVGGIALAAAILNAKD